MARNYSIEKYSENWNRRFHVQEKLLKRVLGNAALEIHHVGSTAVRGMSAKPIVDMLVIVKDFRAIDRAKKKFEKLGYVFRSNYVKPNSRLLEKFNGATKLYNIHFFKKSHDHVPRILNIRDYLQSHPDAVRAYEVLKKKLQKKYSDDYRAYSRGKHEFLDALARRANAWAKAGKVLPQIIKEVGFDFNWDNKKVWALKVPVTEMDTKELIWHFDIPFHWHRGGVYNLKSREILGNAKKYKEEYRRTMKTNLKYPIDIMRNKGRWLILDGLHRLMKAQILGMDTVKVRKIPRSKIPQILE